MCSSGTLSPQAVGAGLVDNKVKTVTRETEMKSKLLASEKYIARIIQDRIRSQNFSEVLVFPAQPKENDDGEGTSDYSQILQRGQLDL